MSLTLTDQDANQLVEWLSELGDLSYLVAPDPNPVGEGMRLRIISSKHILHADPPPPPPAPPATPTIMYDSTDAVDIPASALAVAGYVDGLYAWSQADWDRFTSAQTKLTITVLGANVADVCDCETGDLTPDQAAAWIQNYPGNIVYCSVSALPAVQAAMGNLQYSVWTAHWTGQAHLCDAACGVPAGVKVLATQFADPATNSGGHFDLSLVTPELLARF